MQQRWLPKEPVIGVYAPSYFIAETTASCWKCGESTRVYGLLLPEGHETLENDEDPEEDDFWVDHDERAFVHYVTDLSPDVAKRIASLSPHYRIDFSKTTKSSYWMNHGERCGVKQGDFEIYCEPGGAFCPTDESEAALIVLH